MKCSLFILAVPVLCGVLLAANAPSPTTGTSAPATRKVETTDAAKDFLTQSAKTAGITAMLIEPVGNQLRLTCATTMNRMLALLHAVESTDLAIRPETLKINAPKAGTDQLDVELLLAVNVPKPPPDCTLTACLTTLTGLFPAEGNTIWATSLTNLQNAWQLSGQCSAEKYARDLADRTNANGRFEAAKLALAATQDPATPYTFTVLFLFNGTAPPAASTRP